jgi:hypothetical protein
MLTSARRSGLRVGTVVVLTIALAAFVTSKSVSSRFLSLLPEYAPIVKRLPGYGADGRDPIYFHIGDTSPATIDTEAIRQAGRLLPDDATYHLQVPDSAPRAGDVRLAAMLFLQPSLRSRRASAADWLLSFGSPALPRGADAEATYRLGELVLTKLRRR